MAAVAQAKAYLRIETAEEDALIAGLIATATALCESFTGAVPIVREIAESVPATGCWTRLLAAPVRAITAVETVAEDGTVSALAIGSYAIDIDAGGRGWVRATATERRVRVRFRAGLAEDWATLPDGLRQGIVRLAGHLHAHRDLADDSGPPAAVAALWRPWRRMRLS